MLKSVYALVGPDIFLQLQHLHNLLRQAGADAHRIDIDGQDAALADVLDELRTLTLFAGTKVVVVREAGDFLTKYREQLEEYLAKAGETTSTLVLRVDSLPANQRMYKLIVKIGQVLDCKPPKDLISWIIAHGKRAHGTVVQRDAAALLLDMIGADLGRLDNELAKAALQTDDGTLTAKMVSVGVCFQREQEMWDMTNELAAGRPESAVARWRQLVQLDSSAEFRATTWLTMWLERVIKALAMSRRGVSPRGIAESLKMFRGIEEFLATARTIGEAGAADLVGRLAELDYQSKTGVGDMADNIERFLLLVAARQMQPAAVR